MNLRLWMGRVLKIIGGIVVVSVALYASCARLQHLLEKTEEITRVTSPDGRSDAVQMQTLWGGAAGGIDDKVYIVPKGQPYDSKNDLYWFESKAPMAGGEDVTTVNGTDGFGLRWLSRSRLEISYKSGSVEQFRSDEMLKTQDGQEYQISASLTDNGSQSTSTTR